MESKIKPCKTIYYAVITESDGNLESLGLEQNLESPGQDHWKAEIRLERWRSKKRLVEYLRKCADIISSA